jgi:hypothetical protein
VVSSVTSAVALAEVGQFREAAQYVQKAAKALYESAKEVFERLKASLQRLVELFVETVTRMLAWIDEHKAYLFLMAAAAAGVIVLSVALNIWGLIKLEKLAYAVSAPFFAGLADAGGRAAERFKTLAERYEKWRVDENVINEVINAPLNKERPYLKLARSPNLPKPLVELRKALARKDEVVQDAAVVATLVLYKTLINNAGAYREWAGWYGWARRLVEKQESTMKVEEVERLREAQRRLADAVWQVRKELNSVLTLYSRSGVYKEADLKKLKSLLEVDLGMAEGLAKARSTELSEYGGVNMGTKVYAALLSIARGGIYGHTAMLLMGEGALADIVLSAPSTAYEKADDIARARGEAADPSRSRWGAKAGGIAGGRGGAADLPRVGAADWEDRAASVLLRLLIGYGEIDPQLLSGAGETTLKFRRVERGDRKGFQAFRVYGGVEAFVGKLWIGKTAAYFKVSKEGLRRLVEEAKETAPDLSGLDTSRQYLEWRTTDVSTVGRQIEGATVHSWQLRWYFGLLGGPKSFSGRANVTREGINFVVTAYWSREREDQILGESRWLESLLGRRVESWRELVDAIDWRWVLKKVEELADGLKPWVGPERMSDAEREGLVRRMLGELALLTHFAEVRKVKDDEQGKERAVRLARAVETLSGGRIKGDHANELAKLIIRYAEKRRKRVKNSIDKLAEELAGVFKEDVKRVKGEVWGIVDFILSDMYCLARDCARDEVVRKFVAPALELIMLDKTLSNKFDKEEALLNFGEMYATALAGDGSVEPNRVVLAVGGELGGGAALLRLATLLLLNQLLPDELKFGVRTYVVRDTYHITAYGGDAVRFNRLLAVSAPSAGGEYLSDKFNEFVKEARVEVRLDENSIRLTEKGYVAADLIISEGGVAVKYNVYLSENAIELQFRSTDRRRVELAALLLRHAGVGAEVKKVSNRDVWYIYASTGKLTAGREELRRELAKVFRKVIARGWIDASKAEGWLEELKRGRVLNEGWPQYGVGLTRSGALLVRFGSTSPSNIEREAQRFRDMGLEEGRHFTVKMPEGDSHGYVRILREGLAYAAWLSVYGSDEQQRMAAEFVKYILERAREEGNDVYEKASKIIEEGMSRGSLRLEGFEGVVEVGGREHLVKVIGGGAEFKRGRGGGKLLRIRITAEVDGVRRDYTITYGRRGRDNAAVGRAVARADAPGGREADAERLAAVIKALTGEEPRVRRMKDGQIIIECYRGHLEGFLRYTELAEAIKKWLEAASRR